MRQLPSGCRLICSGILIPVLLILYFKGHSKVNDSQNQTSGIRIEINDIIPESRVVINVPTGVYAQSQRETRVIFYALPNGNSIEQTEGRVPLSEEEWRYDIQHIAAQTRFLRENDSRYNYVVALLESKTKAWTSHAATFNNSGELYKALIDTVRCLLNNNFNAYARASNQRVILASHSGGGRFLFNYISAVDTIPEYIERIIFIDSNYGYETDLHKNKLAEWLKSRNGRLEVFAYVDTTVIINGKPIVSSKGGTGYRSRLMAEDLKSAGTALVFEADTLFKTYKGASAEILIKENPDGRIYHTVLVERNGLIHGVLSGSPLQEKSYTFWGERAYERYIVKP